MQTKYYAACIVVLNFLLFPSIQAQQNDDKTIGKTSFSPMVLTTAADFNQTKSISLEWAIGEIATETLNPNQQQYYTQGMQQPLLSVVALTTSTAPPNFKDSDIQIFPNPVSAILNVNLSSDIQGKVDVSLIDAHGNLLYQMNETRENTLTEIDMSQLPQGIYWFSVRQKETAYQRVYKVIKAAY